MRHVFEVAISTGCLVEYCLNDVISN